MTRLCGMAQTKSAKGFGLRVLEFVPAGAFIIEYIAEVIDETEKGAGARTHAPRGVGVGGCVGRPSWCAWRCGERHRRRADERDEAYAAAPRGRHRYVMELASKPQRLYLDAARKGNVARFVNHSCEPLCEVQIW